MMVVYVEYLIVDTILPGEMSLRRLSYRVPSFLYLMRLMCFMSGCVFGCLCVFQIPLFGYIWCVLLIIFKVSFVFVFMHASITTSIPRHRIDIMIDAHIHVAYTTLQHTWTHKRCYYDKSKLY